VTPRECSARAITSIGWSRAELHDRPCRATGTPIALVRRSRRERYIRRDDERDDATA
jgi:hypothetical protein